MSINATNLDRHELAERSASKMAECLAEAWQKGERRLVQDTIAGGQSPFMRETWRKNTAQALPLELRDEFLRLTGER